jgi:hypothetical protein
MSKTRLVYGGSESHNRNLEAMREGGIGTGSVCEKLKKGNVNRLTKKN